MEMTEGEICRKYKQGVEIKVLAELNATSKNAITDILKSHNVEIRMGKPKKQTVEDYKNDEALKKHMKDLLPEAVKIAIFNQIDDLKAQIEAKQKELEELENFIKP